MGSVAALGIAAAAASAAAWALSLAGSVAFEPYLGPVPPVAAIVGLTLMAAPCLAFLQRRGWIPRSDARSRCGAWRQRMVRIGLTAVPFVIPVIVVDVMGGFPEGINVPAPASLAFYPAIGLVAELAFHVIPLGLAASLHRESGAPGLREPSSRYRRWATGAVASIEPVLQMAWGAAGSPMWANVYVGIHVYAINLLGLWWFRRRGFVAMYAFRLSYYLLWHVAWGVARLELLF